MIVSTLGELALDPSEPVSDDSFASIGTVALDGVDGSTEWEDARVALATAGGVVYTADAGSVREHRYAPVTALDAATGGELWISGEADPYVSLGVAGAETAVLHVHDSPEDGSPVERSMLVETATGEALATVDAELDCVSDGATRMACTFPDRSADEPLLRLFTFDAADPAVRMAADPIVSGYGGPEAMLSGWILMIADTGFNLVVDASGSEIASARPFSKVMAASDEYVVTAGGGDGLWLFDVNVYALA